MNGTLLGRLTDRNVSHLDAPKLCAVSRWRRSADLMPVIELTARVTKASRNTTTNFALMPIPKTRMINGTRATVGVAYMPDRIGSNTSPSRRNEPSSRPNGIATAMATAKPTTHSSRLVPMCGRRTPDPMSATPASKIRDGELMSDDLTSRRLTAISQKTRTATNPIRPKMNGSLMNRAGDRRGVPG